MSTLGGHTTLLVTNIIEAAPNARAGKLRVLGVTTLKRSEVMPEVPTIAEVMRESGYSDGPIADFPPSHRDLIPLGFGVLRTLSRDVWQQI